MATTKHTLVALVTDRPGVLNRMPSLFRRRSVHNGFCHLLDVHAIPRFLMACRM